MTGEIRFEDLPAAVRHRIEDARKAEKREAVKVPGTKAWQCCSCGHMSSSYAAAERHANAHGHTRIEVIFGLDESDDG